jgi:hypothetical protein
MAFPPSHLFEYHGLEDWVILLLGLCHLFLGPSPVQYAWQTLKAFLDFGDLGFRILQTLD